MSLSCCVKRVVKRIQYILNIIHVYFLLSEDKTATPATKQIPDIAAKVQDIIDDNPLFIITSPFVYFFNLSTNSFGFTAFHGT